MSKTKSKSKTLDKTVSNSLTDFTNGVTGFSGFNGSIGTPVNQVSTMFINLRWYMLSNYRNLLSQMYVEQGIVQTLVDQPIDDAFRTGFEIKTGQLHSEDIEEIEIYLEKNQVIHKFAQAMKWARLYGGGGLLIITEQDPATPLDVSRLSKSSKIEFRACDLWELYNTQQNVQGNMNVNDYYQEFYDYYGVPVHHTRVIKFDGKEAPSFIKPRLRGWGMSCLEHMLRSLNQFEKNQNVLFSLMDEAKVDIFGIEGLNSALNTSEGTEAVVRRVQQANQIKDFNNGLVMDKEDTYEQKQISFSGLAEVMNQIRVSLAADTKFPLTKLFGLSASGFNSGEDDIENYNGMVEGDIRSKCKFKVIEVIEIVCHILFGFAPDDLKIRFNPLKVLSAEQEEKVKKEIFARTQEVWTSGGMETEEYKDAINKAALLPVELDTSIDKIMLSGEEEPEKLPTQTKRIKNVT